jgi:hypothetical protein
MMFLIGGNSRVLLAGLPPASRRDIRCRCHAATQPGSGEAAGPTGPTLIPSAVAVERSSGTHVERGKVWVALPGTPGGLLKGRARPTGNRAGCRGPAV